MLANVSFQAITVDNNSNIYATGSFTGYIDFDPSIKKFKYSGWSGDPFVCKLNLNGDFIWAKQFGSHLVNYESGTSIFVDKNKNITTVGYYSGSKDFPCYFDKKTILGINKNYISMIDSNGNYLSIDTISILPHLLYIDSIEGNAYIGGEFGLMKMSPSMNNWKQNKIGKVNSFVFDNEGFIYTVGSNSIYKLIECKGIPSYSIINLNTCKHSILSASGKHTWTTDGQYLDTIINSKGCDSIITYNLKFQHLSSEIYVNACNFYITPSGVTLDSKNMYYVDVLKTNEGCDSTIYIHLSFNSVWPSTLELLSDENSIKAYPHSFEDTTFKWYNCSTNKIIPLQNKSVFKPTEKGMYSVITSYANNCIDTTNCIEFDFLKSALINELNNKNQILIAPNPTNDFISITFSNLKSNYSYKLIDNLGRIIFENINESKSEFKLNLENIPVGIYQLIIAHENIVTIEKIVKN